MALPSQLSRLLEFCMGMMKESAGAVYGCSYAMAALMGTVRQSELGMPLARAKVCVCVCVCVYYVCACTVCVLHVDV